MSARRGAWTWKRTGLAVTAAAVVVAVASCSGPRPAFASGQVLATVDGGELLSGSAAFSPDGARLALLLLDWERSTAELRLHARSSLGWQLTQRASFGPDGGFFPDGVHWLAESSVVLTVSNDAVVLGQADGGWERRSVASGYREPTGVSDDGQVLSSARGVARWSGTAWVEESRVRGVVTGDGQRVIEASVDGGALEQTGPDLTLTSYVARDGGWAVETRSTFRPFAGNLIFGPVQLDVTRDGALAAVRARTPVASEPQLTTTVVLLFARRADAWQLHSRQDGPSVPGDGFSADGRVLTFGGSVDLTQVRSVAGLGPDVAPTIVRGGHLALSPSGDAVVVWRKVVGGAVFELFDR